MKGLNLGQAPAGSRILQNPGIFRDGISLKFYPGIYQKSTGSLGISLSAHKFGQFHTFWRTFLFVKYIRQTKVSSIPSCGKEQERAGVQCCWQRDDQKKSLPHTRESRSLSYCQIHFGLLRDMGFRNKWKVNVCLIDWFLLASLNQLLLVHIEYWLLEGYRVYGICSGPTPMIFVRYTMNRQSGLWIIRLWSLLKAFFQVRKLVKQCFEMNIAF